ncbi:MAG: 4a-hydroxytetrahydrobiopterin dehydratase [Acidimicrobiales bacterium]
MEVLDPTTVDEALSEGIAWERDGRELVKVQTEDDFAGALDFVNRVGELAERADHHPDIEIKWNTVTLRLSTHSAGGITGADLELAKQIDALPAASG